MGVKCQIGDFTIPPGHSGVTPDNTGSKVTGSHQRCFWLVQKCDKDDLMKQCVNRLADLLPLCWKKPVLVSRGDLQVLSTVPALEPKEGARLAPIVRNTATSNHRGCFGFGPAVK